MKLFLKILKYVMAAFCLPAMAMADDCGDPQLVVGWGNLIHYTPFSVKADRGCMAVQVAALPGAGKQAADFVQGANSLYVAVEFVPHVAVAKQQGKTDLTPLLAYPLMQRTPYMLMGTPKAADQSWADYFTSGPIAGLACRLPGVYDAAAITLETLPTVGNELLIDYLQAQELGVDIPIHCGEGTMDGAVNIVQYARSSHRTTALRNGEATIAVVAYHQHFRLMEQGFEVIAWPHDLALAFSSAVVVEAGRYESDAGVQAAAKRVADDFYHRVTWMRANVEQAATQLTSVALTDGYKGQLAGMVVRVDQQPDQAATEARMAEFIRYGLEHLWVSSPCFDPAAITNLQEFYRMDNLTTAALPGTC